MKLREIREARALSQRGLSSKSGVAQDTISDIERGLRKPHPSTIRKLAEALGVEVEDITGGVPRVPKATAPPSLAEWLEARCGHAYLTRSKAELEELFDTAHDTEVPKDAVMRLFEQVSQEYLTVLKPGDISDEERRLLSREVKRDASSKWATAMAESGQTLKANEEYQKSVTRVLEELAG